MEDRVHTARRRDHRIVIGKIALHLSHAERIECGVTAAIETGDGMATLDQAAAQGLAEETAAAGDEDVHGLRFTCRAAHLASFSRPILALWRMSTGKGFG